MENSKLTSQRLQGLIFEYIVISACLNMPLLLYCIIKSFSDLNFNCCFKLHESSYDTGKALQALVKNPIPPGIEKKWVEEEQVICNFFQVKLVI